MIKQILVLFLSMLGTVLFAAVFIFIFANSVSMTCQRQGDGSYKCLIEKQLFGKVTISNQVVNGVTSAETEESCDNDGCAYRTDLNSRNGSSTPFNDVYTDHGPVAQTTAQINSYLQGGGARFSVTDPVQVWVLFLIGGLAAMGLGIEAIMIFAQLVKGFMRR